jgi:oxygen-dependent protoporphyrinogen oxidase
MPKTRVVVIGAGISGLAAAFFVHRESTGSKVDLIVVDSADQPGGVIATRATDEAVIEQGPEAFLTAKPEALDLVQQLGLTKRLISTNDLYRRTFIARGDKLHPLPDGFVMFAPTRWQGWAATGMISASAKVRMAMDLVLPRKSDLQDESLADFVQRRLGREALQQLAEPLIAGIYGGDAQELSAKCTVPLMVQYEREYGSIIRGLWRQSRTGNGAGSSSASTGPRYGLFASFDKGMQALTDELLRNLPEGTVRMNSPVDFILRSECNAYEVRCRDGKRILADLIIIATPANIAGELLTSLDSVLGHKLRQIAYRPATMVNLVFSRQDIEHALNGFGFVVPPREERCMGACTFSSIKFAGRTANDKVLMRISLSKIGHQRFHCATDAEIIHGLLQDLATFVGVKAPPLESMVTRHPNALPQYEVGHMARIGELQERLVNVDGLFLAGNAYGGIGIPDCIASSKKAAQSVVSKIQERSILVSAN